MKETIIALIALALIMGCIWLGYCMRFDTPVITKTKTEVIITISEKEGYYEPTKIFNEQLN